MTDTRLPTGTLIQIVDTTGRGRRTEAMRIGLPWPRAWLFDASVLGVRDGTGGQIPAQFAVLQRWPDTSIKWLLVDAATPLEANESKSLRLDERKSDTQIESIKVETDSTSIMVDTGAARFSMRVGAAVPFSQVNIKTAAGMLDITGRDDCRLVLTDAAGNTHLASIDRLAVVEQGALRVTVRAEGSVLTTKTGKRLQIKLGCSFVAGSTRVSCEVLLHNPQAAHHRGGLWDLGDGGSTRFKDVSLQLRPVWQVDGLKWRATFQDEWVEHTPAAWSLYQDSSGGANWNSDNHLDRNAELSVRFRGYRIQSGAGSSQVLAEGERASPALWVQGAACWIAVSVENFWQNFPKALRWSEGLLQVALFPVESESGFELQGGEQKRHTVYLEFGGADRSPELLPAAAVTLDPEWIEQTGAVPYFVPAGPDALPSYQQYINSILEGANSFTAKREIIDEYGWRNFGDVYADHEAVRHQGPRPLVSHYNNQYDFVYGASIQFLRSGDLRWWSLCVDAARHLIDIDIYHTTQDKAAFNGGLFWHTDHYQPAATSTHRTYSRRNGGTGYGGGPSNEHNYTSGLLYYYYISGDEAAREAIIGLAEWVLAMDDGSRTLFALLDTSPTGLASKTVSADYHHPGRGAANSINALLDAYALCGERRYVNMAEQLLQRCIHPRDDIAVLKLDEPEYRWSYLVFLQVLGKYLDFKREWGELDYCYYYARDSLLHYSAWMAAHEIPYKQQLHKVEIPTETWPAHDVRKAHVMHLAAKYAPTGQQAVYSTKARYFREQCLQDVLSFKTAYLTRPQVILSVYGHIDAYFGRHAEPVPYVHHNYSFGAPVEFVSQRGRLGTALRSKLGLLTEEGMRLAGEVMHRVVVRLKLSKD